MATDCYEYDDADCCFDCHRWLSNGIGGSDYGILHGTERFSIYDRKGHLIALSCCRMEERVRAAVELKSPFEEEEP